MAETFLQGARDTVRNQFCNVLAAADGALDFLGNIEQAMGTQVIENPPLPADINGLIGVFCDRIPGPLPPSTGPTFTGGQCPGTRYQVKATAQVEYFSGDTVFETYQAEYESTAANNNDAATGPIPGTFLEFVPTGGNFFFGPPIAINDASSDSLTSLQAVSNSVGTNDRTQANNRVISAEITEVIPISGPDDCGDVGGSVAPPGVESPVPDAIDVGPPGSETNIPVTVGFGDVVVDVNGSLNVGFNIVNPDFNLTGNLNLTTGDINFNLGGRGPDNEECCLPPTIDDVDTDETGDNEDDETRSVIVGVLVNSVVDEPNFKGHIINQDNGPTIYHPRLANLYFRLRVDGQVFWTAPIKVKGTNQYIQCPADFGASSVVANPVPGVTLRLSPIRRRIPVSEFP